MATDEKAKKQIKWFRNPQGVIEIYANTAHVQWTLDDVRIRLAQMIEDPNDPTPGAEFKAACEERAAVTFSWRNAKLLRDQLTGLITAYERLNGEINTSPKLAAPANSALTTPDRPAQ